MDTISILTLACALAAAALAVFVFLRESYSLAKISFAGIMALLAVEGFLDYRVINAPLAREVAEWGYYKFLAASLLPGFLILFSVTYSRGNAHEFLNRWRLILLISFCLPVLLLLFFPAHVIVQVHKVDLNESWHLGLGPAGLGLQALLLLSSTLALINLERTFRTAVGTLRWRIKFMVLGCAVLLGTQIYVTSQALLFSGLEFSTLTWKASGRLLGFSLVAFSFCRARLAQIDLYPSHEFLYRSLTAVIAGLYLLLVGVFAKMAVYLGLDENLPLKSFVVLVAIVGLAVALMSDRLRQRARHAVSRHFRRPVHDYRKVWTLFAERTTALVTREDLCREVARLVSETFNVLSVTIYLVDERKQQLLFGASTSLPEDRANDILAITAPVGPLLDWRMSLDPVDLDISTDPWVLSLKELSPDFFHKGGGRICVPLVASGRLLGFITLTDRVSGIPFSIEDFDLLKCIAGQVAASLLNARLSSSLLQARELEAFQTMSTFFVHDLKNTALMLSLMLQNLPVHFANPAFRDDSLKAIARTAERINDIISRVSSLRAELETAPVDVDLNSLISSALASLRHLSPANVETRLQPIPTIRADPEQIAKVFTNLFLNAKEAIQDDGHILVETSQSNGWATLSVADNGCGITPEFINRSLFRPFQTTKKKGIGIGMYHSKMIVEAHSGRIEVQSDLGKGTIFRVLLPLKN